MPNLRDTVFEVMPKRDGDVLRLKLRGELDLATAGVLQHALSAAEYAPAPLVALDFSQLAFIDAAGLRLILGTGRRLAHRGRQLVIENPRPPVRRLLALAGIVQGGLRRRSRDAAPDDGRAQPGSPESPRAVSVVATAR